MKVARIAQYNYLIGANLYNNKVSFGSSNVLQPEEIEEISDLKVFYHHIYEYKKGLRNLILTTEKAKYKDKIEDKLKHNKIDYHITKVDNNKINVFFGAPQCIEVVKTFNTKLNRLSPEQDFMLGIMLGYDRVKQCERYMKFKNRSIQHTTVEE